MSTTATDREFVRSVARRCMGAIVLGFAERAWQQRDSHRPAATPTARRVAVAAAGLAPAGAVGVTLARSRAAWRPPRTVAGRILVLAHLASGVVVEELLWRAPLLRLRSRPLRLAAASTSITLFAAAHVRRDGVRSLGVHVPIAAGLTLATLVEGRVRAAVIAHLLYNVVAVCLVDATADPDGAPR